LQTISSAHSVQTGSELMAKSILDAAQMSTASITDGYYWLDTKGDIVGHSGDHLNHIGTDLRNYFSILKFKNIPYYNSINR
jgi:hypothetical protein